ncbi:MAG: leucine-rich repeat protein [Oscillospiraceae bacterium]|nr:leucine-rich repeat protein [Oscillospiraceae bacterium]
MRIKKRLAALVTAVCMGMMAVPVVPGMVQDAAITARAETSGDYDYIITGNDTVTITKYNGTDADVVVPQVIDGKKVTSIQGAFANNWKITSVVFQEGLTTLGVQTFNNCTALTKVDLPDTLEIIEWSAFYECKELVDITIPSNVTAIGSNAFIFCSKLEEVVIPEGVSTISSYMFYGCSNLVSVSLPDSITSIETNAFNGCTKLKNIHIPENVISIDNSFGGCKELEEIVIPKSVVWLSSFGSCDKLMSVTILNPECNIKEGTFYKPNNEIYGVYYFDGIIYGYSGSTAQEYANAHDFTFVALDEKTPTLKVGDIDGSGVIGADDASMVLVAAAALGLDQPSGLDADAEKRADVDGDGNVNSVDASIILTYAAAQGLSEEPLDLMDFVPKK